MTLPRDKVLHFITGMAAYMVAFLMFESHVFALFFTAAAGLAKEIRDYHGYGTPEVLDFVATTLGGLLAYIFIKGYS